MRIECPEANESKVVVINRFLIVVSFAQVKNKKGFASNLNRDLNPKALSTEVMPSDKHILASKFFL